MYYIHTQEISTIRSYVNIRISMLVYIKCCRQIMNDLSILYICITITSQLIQAYICIKI